MKDIAVLIVNYRTPELVKRCIDSVLKQENVRFEVVVVDNHSGDESLSVLRAFGAKIKLIANTENKGFGAACNQAYQASHARYLFLLNSDATLLSEHDLEAAIQFMDEHPACGLAGTRIVDEHHTPQATVWDHYPREDQSGLDFSHLPGEWATVLGACMVIRREAFQKVGGFDERFFLYAEETDLCLRLRKQGYLIDYCESVTVSHVGQASERSALKSEVVRRKKSAKYLFYQKHYSPSGVFSIIKRDLKQARFHLWRYRLKKIFCRLSERDHQKYERCLVSYELARAYLKEASHHSV